MLEKNFFFVGEAPPSLLWNVPGTVLVACRQLPGVHAYIVFLPIFRFERTLSRTLEFFACFRTNGIRSSHVISVYGRTESARLVILDKRRPGSLREPVLLSCRMYTSACAHFWLSMCMLPVEHAHVHFSMCTLSVEHVHACR